MDADLASSTGRRPRSRSTGYKRAEWTLTRGGGPYPEDTMIRGEVVYSDDELAARPGFGRKLPGPGRRKMARFGPGEEEE
jgi:hypothetical protein